MARSFRTHLRCVIVDPAQPTSALCTGIQISVPAGLTRKQACDYVAGVIAGEVARYAAWEAIGFGSIDQSTDWSEVVTK